MLLIGIAGPAARVAYARHAALAIVRRHAGIHLGRPLGRQWMHSRFRSPYLRNPLWEHGYAVDTLETATTWGRVPGLVAGVESALRNGLAAEGERVHVFTHLSHLYPSGSSSYTTYLYRLASDPAETLRRWQTLKAAASTAVVAHGGTISHQHGVGTDHRPYLAAEKGALGLAAIGATIAQFDPDGIMNPGKLID
jgi:alkyldihydroxyacetonephosphate synthase